MPAIPIWRDTPVTIPSARCDFRIRRDNSTGDIVYNGSASARPGTPAVEVLLNALVRPLLGRPGGAFPDVGQTFTEEGALVATFVVQYTTPGGNVWATLPDAYTFTADWSYDYAYTPDAGLAFPVDGKVDPRQRLLFTTLRTGSPLTAQLTDAGGVSSTVSLGTPSRPGTAVLDLNDYPGTARVSIEGVDYTVERPCARWVLHYVNAYGGWDSLLVEGNTTETDAFARSTYRTGGSNATPEGRQTRDWQDAVTRRYTFRTGWLSDAESARMHHLTGSTLVFGEDLASGDIIPLLLTDTEHTRKTYAGEGARLVRYDIAATLARDTFRR